MGANIQQKFNFLKTSLLFLDHFQSGSNGTPNHGATFVQERFLDFYKSSSPIIFSLN
jgi:hypothetical protein